MEPGVTISVVEVDDDYLGVEVSVSSDRYAGSTRIFAGLDDMERFASCLDGFPQNVPDARAFELGSRDPRMASGFVGLDFTTSGDVGSAVVRVEIVESDYRYPAAQASFSFPVEASAIDTFVVGLRTLQATRSGSARLASPS